MNNMRVFSFIFFFQFVAFIYLNFKNEFINGSPKIVNHDENDYDLCKNLKPEYDTSIAMKHFEGFKDLFYKKFENCEKSKKPDNILIYKHLNVTSLMLKKDLESSRLLKQIKYRKFSINESNTDLILLKLDYKFLLKFAEIEEYTDNIVCNIQLIDKKLKAKDYFEVVSKKIFFEKQFNFEIITDMFGFYVFTCRYSDETSVIYEEILNILPYDMDRFKQKTGPYFDKVDNIKKTIEDSKTNPMLNDLPFKTCEKENNMKNDANKMNVLIIGIDSVSYNGLKRAFPLTYQYLKNELENFVFYENYNKIGDNTYPNLLGMFSGVTISSFEELNLTSEIEYYYKIDSTNHDLVPFVWKDFEKLGYVTLYNEESPEIGCFNYIKQGFR